MLADHVYRIHNRLSRAVGNTLPRLERSIRGAVVVEPAIWKRF